MSTARENCQPPFGSETSNTQVTSWQRVLPTATLGAPTVEGSHHGSRTSSCGEGAIADVVVFDLDRVRDVGTFQQPHQLAEGMVYAVVNGQLALDEGRVNGAKNGRVLSLRGGH